MGGLLLLVLVLLVVLALAVASAVSAKRSLERARTGLTDLQVQGDPDPGRALPALTRARAHAVDADDQLDGLAVRLVAAVPVIGRSLDAERAVATVSREVLDAAVIAATRAPELGGGGGVDLAALASLQKELAGPVRRARSALDVLQGTPTALTPPQVGAAVNDAVAVLTPAVEGLENAALGAQVAHGLLGGDGPRRLLVALGNNAELRGSGGYVASVATGRTSGGRLSLGPLQDVVDLADPPATATRVPAPREYVEDYGPLSGDTTQFRSWNMSPDFPASAQVGARVAGAVLGQRPDVVVLLDVPAMTALAQLGPGDLDVGGGRTVSADELQQALLVEAYAQAGVDGAAQQARRADLQNAASQAVSRLLNSDVPALDAVRTLAELARGRHLVLWSAREQEQASLDRLDLAGAVGVAPGEDLLHVAVNNTGSNKLDVYVDRTVELEAVVGTQTADVIQRVRLTNRAPKGLVPYVEGTDKPGTLVSRVEMSLPPDATVQSMTQDGVALQPLAGRGVSRLRLATRVELPRGAGTVLEVRYRIGLRGGVYRLHALPQALAQDAALRLSVRPAPGVRLEGEGQDVVDGAGLREQAPFSHNRVVVVSPPERTWRDRLRSFWDEPVRLG